MQSGATLAPGESVGTLTINGNLSLAGSSILAYEFGQANVAGGALNDLVNVGGDLVLDGRSTFRCRRWYLWPRHLPRVYYGGALTDNGLALGPFWRHRRRRVQTGIAGQVNLVNSQGLALSFWGRRGRTQAWSAQRRRRRVAHSRRREQLDRRERPRSTPIMRRTASRFLRRPGHGHDRQQRWQRPRLGHAVRQRRLCRDRRYATLTGAQALVHAATAASRGAAIPRRSSPPLTGNGDAGQNRCGHAHFVGPTLTPAVPRSRRDRPHFVRRQSWRCGGRTVVRRWHPAHDCRDRFEPWRGPRRSMRLSGPTRA